MTFTEELWTSIAPIYAAILRHPFLRGLTDGSLVARRVPQLRDPGRALPARLRPRAFDRRRARSARGLDHHAERALGRRASRRALAPRDVLPRVRPRRRRTWPRCRSRRPTSPTRATCWRSRTARRSTRALAALLPCYWIYWEVGKELERAGSRDPLFARWIATYASEEFGSVVRAVLEATEPRRAGLTDEEPRAMRRHFVTTSRYEWMFWDMGYRMEQWPV